MYESKDHLFKGCTRPPMLFGIPVTPLVIVVGVVVLLSIYFTILLVASLPLILIAMRVIAASDDQQYRLLAQKIRFRWMKYDFNHEFWKASAYSPFSFEKRK